MTSIQKVIKYLAIAFAIFLIVTIVLSVVGALFIFSGVLNLTEDVTKNVTTEMTVMDIINEEYVVQDVDSENISNLDIELFYTDLVIKIGDKFKVEGNTKNIKCERSGKILKIKEQKNGWFSKNNLTSLIVYIPEDFKFEKADIVAGAGKIHILDFNSKNLDLELGAGETVIEKIYISNECKIEGGAGEIAILSGSINNLDLDLGIGATNISAEITGKNEINAGVGNVNISLDGVKENYKIKVDKGLGSIKINGLEAENGKLYGDGNNFIDIDGGIGNIEVTYSESI